MTDWKSVLPVVVRTDAGQCVTDWKSVLPVVVRTDAGLVCDGLEVRSTGCGSDGCGVGV